MKSSDSAFQLALICWLIDTQLGLDGYKFAGFIWMLIGIHRLWKEAAK